MAQRPGLNPARNRVSEVPHKLSGIPTNGVPAACPEVAEVSRLRDMGFHWAHTDPAATAHPNPRIGRALLHACQLSSRAAGASTLPKAVVKREARND